MGGMTIPWPPRSLSPNSRKDRRASTAERKRYKTTCWALAKESGFRATHIDITFCPPDGRPRDLDNMLASIKSGLDGISAAMGVDDRHWSFTIRKGEPCRPHGEIILKDGDNWKHIGQVAAGMVKGQVS